jgi:DNA topoisomerase I
LVGRVIEVSGKKYEPQNQDQVQPLLGELVSAGYWVEMVEKKSRERSSLPPFTTSTLQQAAANKFGFTSKQTMTLAQQLYEEGLITYHRTDSVSLSQQSLDMVRGYISSHFDKAYLPEKARFFSNTSKNAQEAHEAIRVTDAAVDPENIYKESSKFTDRHVKLYDLIRRRFIASQMTSAAYDQTTITVAADPAVTAQPTPAQAAQPKYKLRSSGSILRFDGWMKLFPASEDTILPAVEQKQLLAYQALAAAQKFTQPPARYNDASLVKELEKRGIGRPSTYASIISVIVDRGYVERLDKRFTATQVGMTVSDFLNKHFPVFMEYDFTAAMEDDLDRVSRGEKAWRGVVKEFYEPLAKIIESVTKDADRVQIPVEKTGEKCPICGDTEHGEVVIRTGRFGKFKSCSRFPECSFTENLVEKLENVSCPLCQQGEVVIKNSRWGKSFFGCSRYPECSWASWKKPEPGFIITPAEWEAQQAERAARKAEREASGKTGRYGAAKSTKSTKTTKAASTKKKTTTKTKTTATAAAKKPRKTAAKKKTTA